MNEKETIELEDNKLYLILNEDEDLGFAFQVFDKMEHTEDNAFISCVLRGMIEYALKDTEECVQLGAEAFKKDYSQIADYEEGEEIVKPEGFSIGTPTVGNA